jgi:protein phosphatase 2C family protein 2/3
VVIATPEITSFKINDQDHDFLVLGCDGVFDKMTNEDVVKCVWNSVADNRSLKVASNVHKQTGMAVEYILKNTLLRRTLDNVTVVMIAFNNFKRAGDTSGNNKENTRTKVTQDFGRPSLNTDIAVKKPTEKI